MKIKRDKLEREINFTYNYETKEYKIDNKIVEQNEWRGAKGSWSYAQSYNHIPEYIKKWGFTECDIDRTDPNVLNITYRTYIQ